MKPTILRILPGVALLAVWFSLTAGGCPSSADSRIEAAQFALDRCNPADSTTATSCQEALDNATAILTDDPGNVQAALLASSANMGLAGIDFLQFAAELVEVQSSAEADFKEFRDLVTEVEADNARTIDLTYLRSSVAVLETAMADKAADSDLNERAFFQLGAIQSIETFVLPVKLITFDPNGEVNPDEITDDTAETLKENFLNGDDNIQAGGTTDADTLEGMREGHCRCELADPLGANYGGACIRDLMRCELSDTGTEDTEQDYDGDGTLAGDRENDCDALINPPGVDTCKGQDT